VDPISVIVGALIAGLGVLAIRIKRIDAPVSQLNINPLSDKPHEHIYTHVYGDGHGWRCGVLLNNGKMCEKPRDAN